MRRKRPLSDPVEIDIDSLSHDGRGIAHVNGKKVFVDNALSGETIRFKYRRQRSRYDEGEAIEIIKPSEIRIEPLCKHFSVCGGCSLQHMHAEHQIQYKEQVLLEQLEHIGKVQPRSVLPALTGPIWGYRHKARLGVKYVIKKEKVLVGFREKRSAFIADIERCEVLPPAAGTLILPLKDLIAELDIYNTIPQIEIAIDDTSIVLVLRHLQEITIADRKKLLDFEKKHNVSFYLQPGGEESIVPLQARGKVELAYRIHDDIVIQFSPLDFTQINRTMNRTMIDRVIELMELQSKDVLLDLFCGLGNFTLPLAKYVNHITGIEGSRNLVERAGNNAEINRVVNVQFQQVDLYNEELEASFLNEEYNKILLDPPRSGAREVIERMQLKSAEKLVYVSCNPATLARDAGILVNDKGFHLKSAGVMDIFPHTTHVESIAVFEK